MRFSRLAAGVSIFVWLITAQSAHADPVRIVSATIELDSGDVPVWTFNAESTSFWIHSTVHPQAFAIYRNCWQEPAERCRPGMLFDPGAEITMQQLSVTDFDTFEGVRINGVHNPDAVLDGRLTINGPLTPLPTLGPEPGATPLEFHGLTVEAFLTLWPDPSRSGMPLLTAQLFGQGSLRAGFSARSDGALEWSGGALYRFQATDPVPEPGTLLLLGSGLVLAAARHRATRGAA